MWIYEYSKFDHSGFLTVGPFDSEEEATRAMKDYAERFGANVHRPKEIDTIELLRVPLKFPHDLLNS